ncbi:Serine/threonine-protein phosphatase with EF-hands 2 [Merluccius polli]|uniref:Serine/threonine-protein phosphatase with EF-hands 2 n=1 Tax=Merluccius polli TaxID=89951 RepID=A0AA47NXX7_MERPO|nr:Serine/threonine-protein phosphatase with EF-hands 2 [Merluccius polli]
MGCTFQGDLRYQLTALEVCAVANSRCHLRGQLTHGQLWLHLQKGEELYGLMATGRKDFLWRSVVHLGGLSLQLKFKKRCKKILKLLQKIFSWLPLATVIDGKVLVVHGGISDPTDLNIIARMESHKKSLRFGLSACLSICPYVREYVASSNRRSVYRTEVRRRTTKINVNSAIKVL